MDVLACSEDQDLHHKLILLDSKLFLAFHRIAKKEALSWSS